MRYGLGITNLVNRTTARADELSDDELRAGIAPLTAKIERFRPHKVAFLGVSTFRVAFERPKAVIGRQLESIPGVETWVLPNPSGLNAHYDLAGLAAAYAELVEDHPASAPDRSPAA